MTESDLFTTDQVAERLELSRRQVQHLIKQGVLPARKMGRDYVVRAADVAAITRRPAGRPRKSEETG